MMMAVNEMRVVDLNADLGEGESSDAQLLRIVSSCNIACGGHAGDEASMQRTVAAALENNVAIGAHPSYPDREGFGRRSRFLAGSKLQSALIEQTERLQAAAGEQGAVISHVKPHGALYNDAAVDSQLAGMIVAAVKRVAGDAALVGLPGSELQAAAERAELPFVAEGFVDRAYQDDGRLQPRSTAGAVHECVDVIAAQAVMLATDGAVTTFNGNSIQVDVDTLCIHGDTPNAVAAAIAVRDALRQQGVRIRAIRR